ncbi:peptidoglycan-recognition protein SC1a/b-like [Sitodiplosis mosellana]|uniref:peptidoglycan-recognition protein SC1a/b-like n=1 Tax=Sitodiplosis mosellana TaxID=263140 RepID=UPI002443852C|nr:peptidoglycan-recognition protein SC1a/b-like [Sitodiplosis mosellana]XP_055301527.1 peptidoglycan-recognition protein SC1a/b-like [Sitodiplosis mosellana]XP_055301528.1 peptidoglycan-recognition protein SC1a/b-like [Sitodiplosis mosellana]XP_055301529.1 peptidoglycan-recognition protein SC1a/b-like [Sitodiplosis mosellana]
MPLEIVSRKEWGANPPKFVKKVGKAVNFVIIHHTATPQCDTTEQCIASLSSIQKVHQNTNGWSDIGYNFIVGGDGKVYEGRGFNVIGGHASQFNAKSIGISLIGNWNDAVPGQNMLRATQEIIDFAVEEGHLASNYQLHGHRQVSQILCPGNALFNEIKDWPHFPGK